MSEKKCRVNLTKEKCTEKTKKVLHVNNNEVYILVYIQKYMTETAFNTLMPMLTYFMFYNMSLCIILLKDEVIIQKCIFICGYNY